jgi:hypothetical protein
MWQFFLQIFFLLNFGDFILQKMRIFWPKKILFILISRILARFRTKNFFKRKKAGSGKFKVQTNNYLKNRTCSIHFPQMELAVLIVIASKCETKSKLWIKIKTKPIHCVKQVTKLIVAIGFIANFKPVLGRYPVWCVRTI